MHLRIITLRFDERLGGFPEEVVTKACAGTDLKSVNHHFFTHAGVPYLTVLLELSDLASGSPARSTPPGPDHLAGLPEDRRKLFLDLKKWRNQTAEKEGVPPFAVMRNEQLAQICRLMPRSLAGLRQIEGIGEKTCAKYGAAILAILPDGVPPLPESPPCEPSADSLSGSSTPPT